MWSCIYTSLYSFVVWYLIKDGDTLPHLRTIELPVGVHFVPHSYLFAISGNIFHPENQIFLENLKILKRRPVPRQFTAFNPLKPSSCK
jgi:hypothetical protein